MATDTDHHDDKSAQEAVPLPVPRCRAAVSWPLVLGLVALLIIALRLDWQQRTLHSADTTLDHESHLIGRLVRFIDDELVAVVSPDQLQRAAQRTGQWWSGNAPLAQQSFDRDLQQLLEARLNESFDRVRAQVDDVADWYYSLRTNYALLYELGRDLTGQGDLEAWLRDEMHQRLLMNSDLTPALDDDMQAVLAFHEQRVERVARSLRQYASRQVYDMAAVSGRLHTRNAVPDDAVTLSAVPMDWRQLREQAVDDIVWQPAVTGVGAAVMTAGAGRLAASATVRRATAQAARKAGARAGSRAASAGAGLTAAGTGAAVCGPLAVVCAPLAGLAAFGASWLATDLVLTRVDESLNRDAFTAALHEQIDALQTQTVTDLHQRLSGEFSTAAQQLSEQHQAALVQPLTVSRPSVVPGERLRRSE
jgi:hypothetical protein